MTEARKQIYRYGRYIVVITDDAYNRDEERKPVKGYAIINSDLDITEATTTYLYKAINLAQLFENTVQNFLKETDDEDEDSVIAWPDNDDGDLFRPN